MGTLDVLHSAISVSEISAHNNLIYDIFTVRLFYCQFISVRNKNYYTARSIYTIYIYIQDWNRQENDNHKDFKCANAMAAAIFVVFFCFCFFIEINNSWMVSILNDDNVMRQPTATI